MNNLAQSWLEIQCQMIAGVSRALVSLGEPERGAFQPVAHWPHNVERIDQLEQAAATSISEGRCVEQLRENTDENSQPGAIIASPIHFNGKLAGAVVVDVSKRSAEQKEAIKKLLHWGTLWLQYGSQQHATASQQDFLMLFRLLASCVEHRKFQASATAVVTEIAANLDCDRVSLGFLSGKHIGVAALSHSAKIDCQSGLIRMLGFAMEEAIDQNAMVTYPPIEKKNFQINQAHAELARRGETHSICTIPLIADKEIIGAITLERNEKPIEKSTVELCKQFSALAGPVLALKRLEDRWLIKKAADSWKSTLVRLIGPENFSLKFATGLLAALVLYLGFAQDTYQVTADANLEGRIQRAVVAPIEGYIATANYRAGDIVKAGDALGTLDDKDILLESAKWSGQQQQLLREYREALAGHDRAKVSILSAKVEQANAQIELINQQLARTRIEVPFDGVVIEGDLSQALGSPVERGEVLFKVAPLNEYRLILNIDERDISEIDVGQGGKLVLTGLPGDKYALNIKKITPVSSTEDGQNFFRVEAGLDDASPKLRPGMQGVAKVDVGQRRVVWIWSHRIVDWFRLWAWQYLP